MLENKVIDIWLTDEHQVTDDSLMDQYQNLLNAQETGRHQRYIFSKHRHQFLVTRALVRTVLAQYLDDSDPASLEFISNKYGKPALSFDSPLQFNVSHTNGLIALAVTRDRPVGVDVEYLSRQADIVKLAERYFSQDESRELVALPVDTWNNRFFDLWTLKESYLKACGTGLSTPLHAFSFHLDAKGIDIGFTDELNDDPGMWQFWQLDGGGSYRLSLALNAPAADDYRLCVRQGIPLRGFKEVSQEIIRHSNSNSNS